MPTRSRPNDVVEVINSLIENVSDKKNIEILLKIDDDDTETYETVTSKFKELIDVNIKILITTREKGYFNLSKYFYELFEISSGEWLFLFNDDLRLLTKNFDLVIKPYQGKINMLHSKNVINGEGRYFPIIHTNIIKTLGHFSIDVPYIDGWLRVIGEKLNIIENIDLSLNHMHPPTPIDDVGVEVEKLMIIFVKTNLTGIIT